MLKVTSEPLPNTFLCRFIFPLFFKFVFNWKIISLQYCVAFYTTTWISHKYTYVPILLNLPPPSTPSHSSRLSQSTGLRSLCHTVNSQWLSILCRVTCMLLSPFIPPSPSPTVHKSVLLCLHLHCCPANRFFSTIFLDSIHLC